MEDQFTERELRRLWEALERVCISNPGDSAARALQHKIGAIISRRYGEDRVEPDQPRHV